MKICQHLNPKGACARYDEGIEESMTDKRVIKLLEQIARGTHDPTPTRMLPPLDNKAA
jgi:hypothetical protein